MKKIFSNLLLLVSAFMLISCSNLALRDDSNVEKSDLEYGTLIIGSNDKSIQVADIVSAKVTVIGSDFTEDVVTITDSINSGKGTYKIEKIPAGDNRVVIIDAFSAESQMEGISISAVVDIKVGDNVLEEINWNTTIKGNVYKELIKAGVATAEFTDEQEARRQAIQQYRINKELKSRGVTKDKDKIEEIQSRLEGSGVDSNNAKLRARSIVNNGHKINGYMRKKDEE